MMVTVSLDSPSCEVTLFDPVFGYRDVTRQAKGLYCLKHVGALRNGLAYLDRYNSGWFCHTAGRGAGRSGRKDFARRVAAGVQLDLRIFLALGRLQIGSTVFSRLRLGKSLLFRSSRVVF
jgi:hypothetical protein